MALMGDLIPYFTRFERLLKSIAGSLCNSGGASASVLVSNPSSNPVNVTLVPAASVPTAQVSKAGTGSIPSGMKSISIVKTSSDADDVIITLSDSSTFTLTEQGEVFVDAASQGFTLPAYAISGAGTFKWHGLS